MRTAANALPALRFIRGGGLIEPRSSAASAGLSGDWRVAPSTAETAKTCQSPGIPFRVLDPRSSKVNPEPATRSRITPETRNVPVDDTHTLHLWYNAYMPPKGVKAAPHLLERVHVYDVPYLDANGEFIVDNIDGQDMMAWVTQGSIADRTRENLGASDKGVALYRRVLKREMKKVADGMDPMGVVRDAAKNQRIDLPNERKKHHNSDGFEAFMMRTHAKYSPIAHEVAMLFEGKKPAARAKESVR